jgi:hypothetical protein
MKNSFALMKSNSATAAAAISIAGSCARSSSVKARRVSAQSRALRSRATLQFVVGIDRFERLDESRRAGRRVTMSDTLNAPAMIGLDWNHETIVANRDQLILNGFGRRRIRPSSERVIRERSVVIS